MLFWFKKKVTVLDCFTYLEANYDHNRIDKAAKFIPDWFKRLERSNFTDPFKPPTVTMKKCSGFISYFANSFAVPMWEYIHCRADNQQVDIKSSFATISSHSRPQFAGFLDDDSYHHIKIETPWIIKSSNRVNFIQTFPTWCYSPNSILSKFIHVPGILEFYYQRSTNVNGFIKKPGINEPPYVVSFEPGVPITFYTPLEDTKIKFKYHLISEDEYKQKTAIPLRTAGPNRLAITKKLIDKRDEEKNKCPFGFK